MIRRIDAPIDSVCVFEDRALVTRHLGTLEAGRHRLSIDSVSPLIIDHTLRLTGEHADDVRLRIHRRLVDTSPADAPDSSRLEQEIDEVSAERRDLKARKRAAEARLRGLKSTRQLLLAESAEAAARGVSGEQIGGALEDFARQLATQSADLAALVDELRRCEKRFGLLIGRRDLTKPVRRLQASLELELELESQTSDIRLEAMVANACWRPAYRARLSGADFSLERNAMIWQNTGIAWQGVAVELSTYRFSEPTEPPALGRDVLSIEQAEKTVEIEIWEEEVQDTGRSAARPASLPGVDDGGTPLNLTLSDRVDVLSDGFAHRFVLSRHKARCERQLIVCSEIQNAAILVTRHDNPTSVPLLAGPVELELEGQQRGRARLDFVAPGERFDLPWGAEPGVIVHRQITVADKPASLINPWNRRRHNLQLELENLRDDACRLEVRERIPVSELDQVKIEVERVEPKAEADAEGMMSWTIDLAASGRQSIKLVWDRQVRKSVEGG